MFDRYTVLALTLLLLAFGTGCELRDAGCVSDDECREGRVCAAGACTGLTDIETDAGDSTTNGTTNGNTNGETNGNTNGDDGCILDSDCAEGEWCDADANACVPACQSAEDCPEDGAVCTWLTPDDGNRLSCAASLNCEFLGGFGEESACGFLWECRENGPREVDCRVQDDGTALCTCIAPEAGAVTEFSFDADICALSDGELADTLNIRCGWRLPVNLAP